MPTEPAGPHPPTDDIGRALVVVAVCTVAIGLGASIGFLWGFVANLLRADLGLSRGQVGLLISVYFGATGVASIAGGVFTDRFGARAAVVTDLVVVTLAATVVVLVPVYPVLLAASVVAGAAYSLGNAGTNVAIAAAVPLRLRATALTVKTAGVPAMAVIGALLAPAFAARSSWLVVYRTIAVLAAIAVVAAAAVLPDDRPGARRPITSDRQLPPGFLYFPIGAFLLIGGSQPLYSWIVPFLEDALELTPAVAGRATAFASAVGVVVMVAFARRSDRLGVHMRVRMVVISTLATAVGVALVAVGPAVGTGLTVAGATLGTAAELAAVGVLHAAVVDAAPRAVGRASGITMTGYYLGALVAPAGFGWLVDRSDGSYPPAWWVTAAMLLVGAAAFERAGRLTAAQTAAGARDDDPT